MPGQSYLVVDSALSDSVLELATVIDHYNPGADYVSTVNSFVIESELKPETNDEDDDEEEEEEEQEILFKDELYSEIANNTQQFLLAIPDKELESIANLIIYIFSFVPESFESLTKTFLDKLIESSELNQSKLNKKKYIRSMAILSILSNIFNFIESTNFEFKNIIFSLILIIIDYSQNFDLLKGLNLKELLISKNLINKSQVKENLIKYSKLINNSDELKSLEILEITINEIDSNDIELINLFLKNSLNSTKKIDLSSILKNKLLSSSTSTSTSTTGLFSLIEKYQTLSTIEFQKELSTSSSSFPELNTKVIITKNQYLNLARLSLSSKDSIISYEELSKNLSINSDLELEKFLILAIQNNIIQAKLSQSDKIVKLFKTLLISEDLTKENWSEIKLNLNEWKLKLKDIKSLIDSSKKKVSLKQ